VDLLWASLQQTLLVLLLHPPFWLQLRCWLLPYGVGCDPFFPSVVGSSGGGGGGSLRALRILSLPKNRSQRRLWNQLGTTLLVSGSLLPRSLRFCFWEEGLQQNLRPSLEPDIIKIWLIFLFQK